MSTIVIRNVSVFDESRGEMRPACDMVLLDGLIREIAATTGSVTDADQVIDGSGLFAIPGLIDSHVHIAAPSDVDATLFNDDQVGSLSAISGIYGVANLSRLLFHGVTAIRDTGAYGDVIFDLKRMLSDGRIAGPEIFAAGHAVAATGGHGAGGIAMEADGPSAIRRAVRLQAKRGADVIKFMASARRHAEGPSISEYTDEELTAGILAAKDLRVPSAVHATNPSVIKAALRAGVDSIEHGLDFDDESFELLQQAGTTYVPTLWVFQALAQFGNDLSGASESLLTLRTERCRVHLESVTRAHQMGVPIAAASDDGFLGIVDPRTLYWDMQWLVAAGLSAAESLSSATKVPARLLGASHRLGSLSEGYAADVVVLGSDPLADIGHVADIEYVIKGGRIVRSPGDVEPAPLVAPSMSLPEGPVPGRT